jgi:hypothetical protein
MIKSDFGQDSNAHDGDRLGGRFRLGLEQKEEAQRRRKI